MKPEKTSGVSIGVIKGVWRGKFGNAPAATAWASTAAVDSVGFVTLLVSLEQNLGDVDKPDFSKGIKKQQQKLASIFFR